MPYVEAFMKWEPIETAPKDGTSILLYVDGCAVFIGCWEDLNWITSGEGFIVQPPPTHWMPLPPGPV